jgi:alkanesulfonate monooxygenase SsuD/methylene tetrahydromethanopterin reductase-like flavin-dependent oxidoreductase (luciferase family)
MIKVGSYLPVYGGWLPSSGSGKAKAKGIFKYKGKEKLPTYDYVKKVSLRTEKIGLDSLWIPDHMLNPIKDKQAPSPEAGTLATAIAEVTRRVIIVHTTLCEAFRFPAVLAKEAKNNLARITGGHMKVLDRTLDTGLVGSPETVALKIKNLEMIGINNVLLQLTPTLAELRNVKKVLNILRNIDHGL